MQLECATSVTYKWCLSSQHSVNQGRDRHTVDALSSSAVSSGEVATCRFMIHFMLMCLPQHLMQHDSQPLATGKLGMQASCSSTNLAARSAQDGGMREAQCDVF